MYRIKSPFEGNDTAWMFISEDKNEIFAAYFRVLCEVNPGITRFKLKGLDKNAEYKVDGEDNIYTGAELMNIGLVIDMWGDFTSKTFRIHRIN